MRRKRRYESPGLRSFDHYGLREEAAMAYLQAGSAIVLCTPNTEPADIPCPNEDTVCSIFPFGDVSNTT